MHVVLRMGVVLVVMVMVILMVMRHVVVMQRVRWWNICRTWLLVMKGKGRRLLWYKGRIVKLSIGMQCWKREKIVVVSHRNTHC